MDKRPIGMFDSGVGGMTVFKELISVLPNEDVIYIGDTASFPYGSKSKETIINLTKKRIENLIEKGVKLIVIACGTATSQALKEVKEIYSVPIIGIIEPTVKYLKQNNIKKIGIMATTGTIRSKGWEKSIKKEIENCDIQDKACPLLAPMAEEGWTTNEIARLSIHEYIKDFKDIQALVLGCTHYPLFKHFIEKELSENTMIINTGETVSKEVEHFLAEHNMKNDRENKAKYQIYLTDTEVNFLNVASQLLQSTNMADIIQKL